MHAQRLPVLPLLAAFLRLRVAAGLCCRLWLLLVLPAVQRFFSSQGLICWEPRLHSLFTASIRHEAQKSAGASQALLILSYCGYPQHSWCCRSSSRSGWQAQQPICCGDPQQDRSNNAWLAPALFCASCLIEAVNNECNRGSQQISPCAEKKRSTAGK